MKYFDGMTDSDKMTVSFNGSGYFYVFVKNESFNIKPLRLIKIYGSVFLGLNLYTAYIEAEYIRVCDWGQFNFMNYGKDYGNPNWKKLNKIPLEKIYSSNPDDKYYEDRLGKRE